MTRTVPPSTPPPDSEIQDFADMSAALTGFQSSVLKPALDPLGLAAAYYEFAVAQVGAPQMQALLEAFRGIKSEPAQTIADTLLETAATDPTKLSQTAYLAQSIVAMWYLGSWYPPGVLGGGGFAPAALQVISSAAYTNGLVWSVMQSHPMGFSPFTFGYWSQAPGPLSSFGVNTGDGGGQ